jgi:hypothetical protein
MRIAGPEEEGLLWEGKRVTVAPSRFAQLSVKCGGGISMIRPRPTKFWWEEYSEEEPLPGCIIPPRFANACAAADGTLIDFALCSFLRLPQGAKWGYHVRPSLLAKASPQTPDTDLRPGLKPTTPTSLEPAGKETTSSEEAHHAGVGLMFVIDAHKGFVVQNIMKDSPADLSGKIHQGDVLKKVDDVSAARVHSLGELSKLIMGPAETSLSLTLEGRSMAATFTVPLVRSNDFLGQDGAIQQRRRGDTSRAESCAQQEDAVEL